MVRDHFGYGPNQWEKALLLCNAFFRWLSHTQNAPWWLWLIGLKPVWYWIPPPPPPPPHTHTHTHTHTNTNTNTNTNTKSHFHPQLTFTLWSRSMHGILIRLSLILLDAQDICSKINWIIILKLIAMINQHVIDFFIGFRVIRLKRKDAIMTALINLTI